MQSALKCNEIEKGAEVKPTMYYARTIQKIENSMTQWASISATRFVAPRGATMVHEIPGEDPDFSTISVILNEYAAGGLILKERQPAERNGPVVAKKTGLYGATSLRGVSFDLITELPGATFPFQLVYLDSTNIAHSLAPSVRLVCSLDHPKLNTAKGSLGWLSCDNLREK